MHSISTHIVSRISYLKKDPVSTTNCIRIPFCYTEAATGDVLLKKVFLKTSQILQQNIYVGVSELLEF